tara:strand:+ start:224 stop:454 length:231 start_codon:yes stop_codon:yes gene_type:complete
MGGLWYGLTRLSEPIIGKQASKEQGEKNEKYMRKASRETIIPAVCAIVAVPEGPLAATTAFAAGKEAAKIIYPEDK